MKPRNEAAGHKEQSHWKSYAGKKPRARRNKVVKEVYRFPPRENPHRNATARMNPRGPKGTKPLEILCGKEATGQKEQSHWRSLRVSTTGKKEEPTGNPCGNSTTGKKP
ncbi:hypothetical protein QYF36_020438 [Acer negundo]|nr:hypothetical protein QYF36_020438 [Acer negundo]